MSWFYRLGQMAGPKLRKGQWLWQSVTGAERDVLEAEYRVGCDLHQEMVAQTGIADDPRAVGLVQQVGQALVGCVRNKHRRFCFTVIGGAEPNAFALPGGFVYITHSLLQLMESKPDEVAFVVGHEMGHVIKQHPMERIMNDTALSAVARALPAARGVAGRWLQGSAMQMLQSAYSQENELLADRFGVKLSQAAGYDPHAGIAMLQRLQQRQSADPAWPLAEYFSTHPPLELRLTHLRRYIDG